MNLEAAAKMAVYDLDFDVLVDLLVSIPLASDGLRHSSMQSSLLGYIHPTPGRERELQFIKDMFTLGTAEMVERWYGGHLNASRRNADLMDNVIADLRKPAEPVG